MTEPTEEKPVKIFEATKKIYYSSVKGYFRRLKWYAMIVLLGIYYLTPFIRWDRGPLLPNQAILIDITNGRGYFFFIELWPQEVHYIMGILILAAVILFFVTSILGRIWCGYACPQTVWTDLFSVVERFFQGNKNQRIKLDKAPFSFNKAIRKILTHISWIIISALTGGAWVLYFNDAPTVIEHLMNFDMPWSTTVWILALTVSTYIMAGFAREQVCIYMCPYARFQSAMFDKDTLIIGYDEKRGEPKGKHKKGDSWEGHGDCIDCTRCVQVCPMGIDIRDGLQMECITCGLCIDACDDIMEKIGRPKKLIGYNTANNISNSKKKSKSKLNIIHMRSLYYIIIISIISGLMLWGILNRAPMELNIIHDRNPLFVRLSNGKIRNGYIIKILNKTHYNKTYKLAISGIDNANIVIKGTGNRTLDDLQVFTDDVGTFRVFISAKEQKEKRTELKFILSDEDTKETIVNKTIFMGSK